MFKASKLARLNRAMGLATMHSMGVHVGRELFLWGLIFFAGGISQFCVMFDLQLFSNLCSFIMLVVFGLILFRSSRKCDCGKRSLPRRFRSRKKVFACIAVFVLIPMIVAALLWIVVGGAKTSNYAFIGTLFALLGIWLTFLGVSGRAQQYLLSHDYTMDDLQSFANMSTEEADYLVNSLVESGELELANRLLIGFKP